LYTYCSRLQGWAEGDFSVLAKRTQRSTSDFHCLRSSLQLAGFRNNQQAAADVDMQTGDLPIAFNQIH
jgi:hypothetical protein